MIELNTIQKREKLNKVYAVGEIGYGNAYHNYIISPCNNPDVILTEIKFQHGPRFEEGSRHGIATVDLMEICRNQLQSFQSGDMATREGAIALTHIEEALLWMNKRTEDRIERNVLGTTRK